MTQPGIEPRSPWPLTNTLTIMPNDDHDVSIQKEIIIFIVIGNSDSLKVTFSASQTPQNQQTAEN